MVRAPLFAAAAVACMLAVTPAVLAKGGKEAPAKVGKRAPEWSQAGGRDILEVFDPSPLRAYVVAPTAPDPSKKAELVVALHGHGGIATGMLEYAAPIAESRKAYCLACQGSGSAEGSTGAGWVWNDDDVKAVLACVDATLSKYEIDPKRVVLMGDDTGGKIALETYSARPQGFAGIYTMECHTAPTGAQRGARIVALFGDYYEDARTPAVMAMSKLMMAVRVVSVEGLRRRELPNVAYSREMLGWLLDGKAPSDYFELPYDPAGGAGPYTSDPAYKKNRGGYRHVFRYVAGGRGAPADAPPSKEVKALMVALAKAVKERPKELPPEVAALLGSGGLPPNLLGVVSLISQDPLSKDSGGVITGEVVARYGKEIFHSIDTVSPTLLSPPIATDCGWHVVFWAR